MKSFTKISSVILLMLFYSQNVFSQVTSFCGSDTIILSLDNYSVGAIQWQESYDGSIWKPIPNQNKSSYKFFTSEEKYYRAQIITSSCEEIYSRLAYVTQKAKANAGIDQLIYGNRTVLSANTRNGASGKWKIISGTGCTFSDITIANPLFEGLTNNNYTLVWTLSNSCGESTDSVRISFMQNQYKPNYIVVDTTDIILSTPEQITAGIYRIRFSEAVTGINDSIMLIGLTGDGFLRKVSEFTYEGNNTYLFQTEQGMIDDLCLEGVFNLGDNSDGSSSGKNVPVVLDKIPTRQELKNDVRFRNRVFVYQSTPTQKFYNKAVKGTKAYASSDINLVFNNTSIGWTLDNAGSYLFSEQLVLNGTYSFEPNYKFDLLVKNKQLKYLKTDLDNAVLEKNLKTIFVTAVTGTIPENDKQSVQKSLYKNSVKKVLVIGQVPVVVTTETELFINATVSGSGVSTFALEDKTHKEFSAGLTNEAGLTTTHEDLIQTGTIKAGASISGDMVIETNLTPVIRSKLYGVDGPFVFVPENSDALLCGVPSGNSNTLWAADIGLSMETEMGSKVTLSRQIVQTISAWFPIGESSQIKIPEKLDLLAGNNQSGPSGERLPQPLRIKVTDNIGYPVKDVEIKFEVTKGNGSVNNPVLLTSELGIAETYFTLGISGNENEVRVSAVACISGDINNSPLIFNAVSTSAGNSDDCINSSLAVGVKINENGTAEPYGIAGVAPYAYSVDGVTYSAIAPQLTIYNSFDTIFYIKDSKGCQVSRPWVYEDPCLNSDLNISVAASGSDVTLTGTGGMLPYQFALDLPTAFTSNILYSGLADGIHTAYIMDGHQCIRSVIFVIGGTPGGGGGGSGLPLISVPLVTGQTETTATVSGTVTVPDSGTTGETGFCWGLSPSPTLSNFHTVAGIGAGSFSAEISGLDTATIFYARIYTITSTGIVYGNEVRFSTKNHSIRFNPNLTYGTITDIEGNIYKTIQIGNQDWMAENLRTTKFNDGNQIMHADDNWLGLSLPGYCWYNNDSLTNKYIYGALYNGYTISTGNVCPTGWHVPTDSELTILTNYLGGGAITGTKLKEAGTNHWKNTNPGATNESGFTALPGSGRGHDASFSGLGSVGYWWSSTEIDQNRLWYWELKNVSPGFERRSEYSSKLFGFPVRCIKDGSQAVSLPALNTSPIISITDNSAFSGGTIILDGGANITARGVCWSSLHTPTVADSLTNDGTGFGSYTSQITGLKPGKTYNVRAYATNSAGTAYGNQISFTTLSASGNGIIFNPNLTYGNVSDIDGNTYKTIQIGTQVWMAENLKTRKFNNGVSIQLIKEEPTWITTTSPAYCYYRTDTSEYKNTYGAIYNWYTAASGNICPAGWHVPIKSEFDTLVNYLGGTTIAGGKLRETSLTHWNSPNTGATNESGFTGLPGGIMGCIAAGCFIHESGQFWSSEENGMNGWHLRLFWTMPNADILHRSKSDGMNIRCIQDNQTVLPSLTTVPISGTTYISASTGGNITNEGGSNVTSRGVCWSTSNSPTIQNNIITNGGIGSGSFICVLMGLSANTKYYIRAFAINSSGTGYGNEISFTTLSDPGNGLIFNQNLNYGNLTDIDGNSYKTIQIGTQLWMAENLRTSKYKNGASIENPTTDNSAWLANTTGAYAWHWNNETLFKNTVGGLYNWNAVATENLCPAGWHIPNIDEWAAMSSYLGGNTLAGGKLKEVGGSISHWNTPNGGATNESGFTAISSGMRFTDGVFDPLGLSAVFWASGEFNQEKAWEFGLSCMDATTYLNSMDKKIGASVRCIKNTSGFALPSFSTTGVSNITQNMATITHTVLNDGPSITVRGVCWSSSHNPTIDDNKTNDGSGTGSHNTTITGLTPNTTYFVRAYATNSAGTAYGNQVSFTTSASTAPILFNPDLTYGSVTDIDGNTYKTIQIGTQTWMAENLKVTKYKNGSAVTYPGTDNMSWQNNSTGAFAWYNNDSLTNKTTYGALYNWYAAANSNLCPSGWHVPSHNEWLVLGAYVGESGDKLKETSVSHWLPPNSDATNEFGFTGIPGGLRGSDGSFGEMGYVSYWWSSTENGTSGWPCYLLFNYPGIFSAGPPSKSYGFAVRCLKDTK